MEPGNDTTVSSQSYRYSIPRLTEIGRNMNGRNINAPVKISRFSVDAIQGASYIYIILSFFLHLRSTFSLHLRQIFSAPTLT
jgi:hypothetical protein